jgi:hypothetical protein
MATIINQEKQDYFVKLAPDFSVFDLAEKYYYDNDISTQRFKEVFEYAKPSGTQFQSEFHRAMFLVYTDVNITVEGLGTDEYVVFPYRGDSQIVIVIKESPIKLIFSSIDANMLVLGVAF